MAKETDIEHIDLNNLELQNALQIIQYTHRSLFLTGKAGTGKSTFLRYISQTTKKKHVILAPTGIAAINVGGSTLHSFSSFLSILYYLMTTGIACVTFERRSSITARKSNLSRK